jgi:hypothetical protein
MTGGRGLTDGEAPDRHIGVDQQGTVDLLNEAYFRLTDGLIATQDEYMLGTHAHLVLGIMRLITMGERDRYATLRLLDPGPLRLIAHAAVHELAALEEWPGSTSVADPG